MAGEVWTDKELEATVNAYLQMLQLELDGKPYNKSAIRKALLSGPLQGRTTSEQRMQNISAIMEELGRPWIAGYKPLHNIGVATKKRLVGIIAGFDVLEGLAQPLFPPVPVPSSRKLPPTGYWMFVCNRARWDGEGWLRLNESELLYMVSGHNAHEVQVGDVGVLRLNKLQGTSARPERPAGVYALVEVIEAPAERADDNDGFYKQGSEASVVTWRAKLRVLANLVDAPVDAQFLPADPEFEIIRNPLPNSTLPIARRAFVEVVTRSGVDTTTLAWRRLATTVEGVRRLERTAQNLDPNGRERVSRYIERGPIGEQVKAARQYRCQVCEALRSSPVAFHKKDGRPYAEAHHVQPVSLLIPGSLGEQNIMVLCPNHHRQAHYGQFEVVDHLSDDWRVEIDGKIFLLPRTRLSGHPGPTP